MQFEKIYTGVDISKSYFDVAYEQNGSKYHYRMTNDLAGFTKLLSLLDIKVHHVVMEASGPYYLKLATWLYDQQMAVSVINPLVIRRFCQMKLSRAKTDKKDALLIAQYGKTQQPPIWTPEPAYILELRQMQATLDQLNKSRTGLNKQIEAFDHNTATSKDNIKAIRIVINCIDLQITDIELKMQQLAELYHSTLYKQLQSIPGLGKKTALLLIVVSGGFKKFSNAKQLSSYFGLSPRIFESGTSVKGKAKITKMGMSRIRAMLYVCAWSAKKCNQACKEMYDRLVAKGKSKRLALIAVANKLVKQAFAIATQNTTYEPNYQKNICF